MSVDRVQSDKHNVVFMALGGSIEASIDDLGSKRIDQNLLQGLVKDLEAKLESLGSARFVRICSKPSHDLDFAEIRTLILELRSVPSDDVAVIFAGTDSLEEVGFLTALIRSRSNSLIVATMGDGTRENVTKILDSVAEILNMPSATNIGTRILIDDQIHPAFDFLEEKYFAFESRIGQRESVVEVYHHQDLQLLQSIMSEQLVTRITESLSQGRPKITVINSGIYRATSSEAEAIEKCDAVVIAGYGAGNSSHQLVKNISRAFDSGKPVILISTHPSMGVRPISSVKSGSATLLRAGAWNGGRLSLRKALLLVTLLYPLGEVGRVTFESIARSMD